MFRWEWVREYDTHPETGERIGAEFVAFHGHPVSCERGVNSHGLEAAAEDVARWIQAELHRYGEEPLELGVAIDLWMLRLGYVNALYWLGGDERWKEVEARAAPHARPLSICIGSGAKVPVQALYFGDPIIETMHGYRGCLRTFPVVPHGRGKPWATWCPRCRPGKTNWKKKAISELQRRTAEIGRRP